MSRKPFDSTLRGSSGSIPSYSFSSSSNYQSTPAASKGNLPSYSSNLLHQQNSTSSSTSFSRTAGGLRSPHQMAASSIPLIQDEDEDHEEDIDQAPMIQMDGHVSHSSRFNHSTRGNDHEDEDDMQPFVSAPSSRVTSPVIAPGSFSQRPASLSDVAPSAQDHLSSEPIFDPSSIRLPAEEDEEPNVWNV